MIEREEFKTRSIAWVDQTNGVPRESTIILQNKNGPCSLVALANILILRAPIDAPSPLSTLSSSRSSISTEDLLHRLGDALLSTNPDALGDSPESVFAVLPNLISGMTINPRFESHDTFETTPEIKVCRNFFIDLVHGWLPSPEDPAYEPLLYCASYENATRQIMDESPRAPALRTFLEAWPTQLTDYGVSVLHARLAPGSLSMFFRNDHFATLYKHPQSGQLFLLVTDEGYLRSGVVWESLSDVAGRKTDLYTAEFSPVGFSEDAREDADFQLARHLQEQQDAIQAQELSSTSRPYIFREKKSKKERENSANTGAITSVKVKKCVIS